MFDLEPKNIKAKIRQQSLTKVFTVLIFGLSILIIVSEYQKYSEWNFKFRWCIKSMLKKSRLNFDKIEKCK